MSPSIICAIPIQKKPSFSPHSHNNFSTQPQKSFVHPIPKNFFATSPLNVLPLKPSPNFAIHPKKIYYHYQKYFTTPPFKIVCYTTNPKVIPDHSPKLLRTYLAFLPFTQNLVPHFPSCFCHTHPKIFGHAIPQKFLPPQPKNKMF